MGEGLEKLQPRQGAIETFVIPYSFMSASAGVPLWPYLNQAMLIKGTTNRYNMGRNYFAGSQ
jgi:hypothetical protein